MSTTAKDAFGIDVLTSSHPKIRQLRRQYPSKIHGNKLWSSSYLLMDYFRQNPLDKSTRVMEIGCGWGLAGLYLDKHFGCTVTAIDADANVFPYLQLHAEINACDQPNTAIKRFEELTVDDFTNIDVLIAADVCFWDDLTEVHSQLIDRALQAGVSSIVYADPMRPPFLALLDECAEHYFAEGFQCELALSRKVRGAIMLIENA